MSPSGDGMPLRVGTAGFRSCARVAAVPGAVGPAVRAWRAAESSPWWTRCCARSLRLWSLLYCEMASGLGCCVQVLAVASSWPQLPGRFRDERSHNFHALVLSAAIQQETIRNLQKVLTSSNGIPVCIPPTKLGGLSPLTKSFW